MDYGKSGNPKATQGAPKFDAHSKHAQGAPKQRPGMNSDKAAFLARIKAAAEAAKKPKTE